MLTIRLTNEQRAAIERPVGSVTHQGGFQRLLNRLQTALRRDPGGWLLRLSCEDARAVLRYSARPYGSGTYQQQLRAIAPDVERALETAGQAETYSLF